MPDAFDAEYLAELEEALERTRLDSPFHVCAISLIAEVRRLKAEVVPQTYGEAIGPGSWGVDVVDCPGHEWDNRTTIENAVWLIRRLQARLAAERTRLYRRGDAIAARGWEFRAERDRLVEACIYEDSFTEPDDPEPGTPYTLHSYWVCVLTPDHPGYGTKAEAIAALREAAGLDPTPPERRPPDKPGNGD